MKRILLSLLAAAALLFPGLAAAQVSTDAIKTGIPNAATLIQASASASSVTGTTTVTPLGTVTIPAGSMGDSGGVLIYSTWSMTSSANTKTTVIRFGGAGGTQYLNQSHTTVVTVSDMRRIRNRSATTQVGSYSSVIPGLGSHSGSPVTSSINTNSSVDIVFTCQLASAGETCTLENYEVWRLP